jgi:hypothetical protein
MNGPLVVSFPLRPCFQPFARGLGIQFSQRIQEATFSGLDVLQCQSTLCAQEFYRKQGFVALETAGVEPSA